jgi:glycolate oxidase FAD binding subunit
VQLRQPMQVRGAGTAHGIIGPQAESDVWDIDMTGLAGIVDYDPDELVITVNAGTPVAEVQALLAQHRQMLAFDPIDCARLLGRGEGGTIGGMISVAQDGPRRVTAGALRDHLLGFRAVSGHGDGFKAGGRVVKNVTGFDLPKVFAGAWGTLGVLESVTLRLVPTPRYEATLILDAPAAASCQAMLGALSHQALVSCAAYRADGVFLRIEGFKPSVTARFEQLAVDMAVAGTVHRIEGEASAALWTAIAEVQAVPDDCALWRLSLPATSALSVLEPLRDIAKGWVFDWGGARLWLGVADSGDAEAALARRVIKTAGGRARLVRAATDVRAAAGPETVDEVLKAVGQRVKAAFDPYGLFNPGLNVYEL